MKPSMPWALMHPRTLTDAANSLDGLSHLWRIEANVSFSQKQLKRGLITCPLSLCPSDLGCPLIVDNRLVHL